MNKKLALMLLAIGVPMVAPVFAGETLTDCAGQSDDHEWVVTLRDEDDFGFEDRCADIGAVSDMSKSLCICGEIIDGPRPWQYGTNARPAQGRRRLRN